VRKVIHIDMHVVYASVVSSATTQTFAVTRARLAMAPNDAWWPQQATKPGHTVSTPPCRRQPPRGNVPNWCSFQFRRFPYGLAPDLHRRLRVGSPLS
jgi:hypothetical protein